MYRRSRRYDEALAAGRRAIELAPDYPQSFNNVGGAYFELGDYAQGRRTLWARGRARSNGPQSSEREQSVRYAFGQGRASTAVAAFETDFKGRGS
jgi:tetratricopeptide (TPR) repeat protein